MLYRLCILAFAASASAFSVVAPLRGGATRASMPKMADIGDTGVSFETVAREWRCKFSANGLHVLLSCCYTR